MQLRRGIEDLEYIFPEFALEKYERYTGHVMTDSLNLNPIDENARERFLEIQKLFTRLSLEIVCPVVESYYIWRTLYFLRSIPEKGEEIANKNANLMRLYNEFFLCTENRHYQAFILGLIKIFDNDPNALSMNSLIKEIQKNKDIFTFEILRSVHPHIEGTMEGESYSSVDLVSIRNFQEICEKYKNLILILKNERDKKLAHTDIKTVVTTFIPDEVEELIKAVQEVFNKLSRSFDRSFTTWESLTEDCIRSTEFLFENLERGEIARQKEIDEKYKNYH